MTLSQKIIFGIVFPLMFCSIGSFFARKGYVHFKTKRNKKLKCLSQTYGKIISVSAMRINRSSAYFPTYEYVVGDEVIRVDTNFGTTNRQYKRGDQVKIWYDENQPNYSYIDGYKEDTIAAVASLVAGVIVVLSGLFVGGFVWFG